MKDFYEALLIFVMLSHLITACGTKTLPTQTEGQPAQKLPSYEVVLGKSITDQVVLDFIVNHNCYSADQFELCKEIGMAWWIGSDQRVKLIYLYAGGDEGFKRYRGTLPFGLTFYDPMWRAQEKLRDMNENNSLNRAGLPDEASSPDHMHYWAVYRQLGMTIVYNSPSADEDAYIYAILIRS